MYMLTLLCTISLFIAFSRQIR